MTEVDRTLYVLSEADNDRIFRDRIVPNELVGTPQEQPLAIIVSGQTGAGTMVGDLLAAPDGVLLGAGQHGDGLGEFAVGGQRPVGVHVGAHDVRQDQGVTGVGLLAATVTPCRSR
ncbi:hypothetical protein GCM10020295_00400 [Streptomyces cinereospinus]